jgi:hypothetical protein
MMKPFDLREGGLQAVLVCKSINRYPPVGAEHAQLTHCASYCFRPSALVMGSSKTASSVHVESFFNEGLPAKS